jgi:hypothetical protein
MERYWREMVMALEHKMPRPERPQSEYERLDYERCEVCGAPIAKGKMPPGPYPTPVYIQCHHRQGNGARCGHKNRFPR